MNKCAWCGGDTFTRFLMTYSSKQQLLDGSFIETGDCCKAQHPETIFALVAMC